MIVEIERNGKPDLALYGVSDTHITADVANIHIHRDVDVDYEVRNLTFNVNSPVTSHIYESSAEPVDIEEQLSSHIGLDHRVIIGLANRFQSTAIALHNLYYSYEFDFDNVEILGNHWRVEFDVGDHR